MERRIANIVFIQNRHLKHTWRAYVERFVLKSNGFRKRYVNKHENDLFSSASEAWITLQPFIDRIDTDLYELAFNGKEVKSKEMAIELGESLIEDFRFDISH